MGMVVLEGCKVSSNKRNSPARIATRRPAGELSLLPGLPQFSAPGGGRAGGGKLVEEFWLSPCGFFF